MHLALLRLPGEGGRNPIPKSDALILISVIPAKARDGGEAGPEPAPGTSSLAGGQRAIVVVPGLVDCRFRGLRRNTAGSSPPRKRYGIHISLPALDPSGNLLSPPACGGRGRGPIASAMGRVRWAAPRRGTGSPISPRPSPPPRAERENSERFLHSGWMCECRGAEAGTQGKRLKSLDSHLRRNDGMSDRSTHPTPAARRPPRAR
jgi:hypothetical protein